VSLFFQELKKIWRPGILLMIGLLGAMYYYIFPSFYITYFSNGPTAEAEFELASGWLAQYGSTMEPSERTELEGQLAEEIRQFNEHLPEIPVTDQMDAAGIQDYATFETVREAHYAQRGERADMDAEYLFNTIMNNSNYYKIRALENYIANYDWHDENSREEDFSAGPASQRERVLALEQGPRGFLPDCVVTSTTEYAQHLAVWVVLSVVLLLSPTLVRDRLNRTRAMQWASRRGRRVLHSQFAAGLCSAVGLTVVNLVIYTIPLLGRGPQVFWNCPLFNWSRSIYTWFDGTYGQYLLFLLGLLGLLGIAAGGLTLFLSQYSGNYISMLLKAIPLFLVVGVLFGSWLLDRPLFFRPLSENSGLYLPKGTEAVCMGVLLVLSLSLCGGTCRRQRRRELFS